MRLVCCVALHAIALTAGALQGPHGAERMVRRLPVLSRGSPAVRAPVRSVVLMDAPTPGKPGVEERRTRILGLCAAVGASAVAVGVNYDLPLPSPGTIGLGVLAILAVLATVLDDGPGA
ncbi:hypothetical protein T492DRAFT_919553 [Pavlovales sp. CCMP2436]|nr:hypothetical protein T492DRAFT_919553 [Pavlovales sp. CCMP2436]